MDVFVGGGGGPKYTIMCQFWLKLNIFKIINTVFSTKITNDKLQKGTKEHTIKCVAIHICE